MVGTIIECLDGIKRVTYYGTGVGRIECSTEGTTDDNPDSLMLICWCVSVEVHLFRTNVDTIIVFLYGRILGRTHITVINLNLVHMREYRYYE